jgi:hypothetical protein
MSTPLVEASEALHERVRAFAHGRASESFEALALAIAHFQAEYSPGFARLVRRTASALDSVDHVPAVPADAFRMTRVAVHDRAADVARFVTSGTTASERGTHAFRTTRTYAELALKFGRTALLTDDAPRTVVALAPKLDSPPASSLGFMMGLFMEGFDGRGLDDGPFDLTAGDRWLLSADGIDLPGLERAIQRAARRREPLLLLATSFALVALLDTLAGAELALPAGSVVMQTGGFKGRSRVVPADELRQNISSSFLIPETHVVSEYGMTELSSQLYEGTLNQRGARGLYLEPPWLRVTPVDPVTLTPVAPGEVGLARFVDLGNIDSAVAVLTLDRVRRHAGGIELLGRDAGAPPRGCSLAVEALLAGSPSDG